MAWTVKVEGLAAVRAEAQRAGPEMEKQLTSLLRVEALTIVARAKASFMGLGGTGPKASQQVTGGITGTGAFVQLRESGGYVFPREFGSKGPHPSVYWMKGGGWAAGWSGQVTRTVDYSVGSQFGTWTGNQFTVGEGTAGRAFYPAVSAGVETVQKKVEVFADEVLRGLQTAA